jgi:hypothetical protein
VRASGRHLQVKCRVADASSKKSPTYYGQTNDQSMSLTAQNRSSGVTISLDRWTHSQAT